MSLTPSHVVLDSKAAPAAVEEMRRTSQSLRGRSFSRRFDEAGSRAVSAGLSRFVILSAFLLFNLISTGAEPQLKFPPPEFETGYSLPTTQHPIPPAFWREYQDVLILALVLAVATWTIYKKRSRPWVIGLSLFSLLYFGFYREGCICAIGSIQNIALGLTQSSYAVPASVVAFFALPLVATLFFGRTFCAAVCPHGALQDLLLIKPLKVPLWVERGLSLIPFAYLGVAVLLAATGSMFLICRYDPFIPVFRLSGSFAALLLTAAFVLAGLFIGRPYCRFLCPYGAMLRMASAVAKWRIRITPSSCTQCRLCADSCPFGVIRQPSDSASAGPPDVGERRRLVWLLVAWPLLLGASSWSGSRFADAIAFVHPRVHQAQLYHAHQNGKSREALDLTDQLTLTNAERRPTELLADAAAVQTKFHLGGWALGIWIGLVAGTKFLSLSTAGRHLEFEPERSSCFACARCFAYCPEERLRLGMSGQRLAPNGLVVAPERGAIATAATQSARRNS